MVHSQNQNFQRIWWREHLSELLKHFKLTTVTYGTASAPCLAIRAFHRLTDDEKLHHPQACRVLKENFDVDDVLTGRDTLKESQALQLDRIKVLLKGGFNLQKWVANQNDLLESIPSSHRETNVLLNIDENEHVKILW